MLRTLAHSVFRCFRRFERWTDRVTGRAGPVFIALAAVLIAICAFTFFDVIFPYFFLSPNTHPLVGLGGLLACTYLVVCIGVHYRLVCSISPGSPLDPLVPLERTSSVPSRASAGERANRWQDWWKACFPGGSSRSERSRAAAVKAFKTEQAHRADAATAAAEDEGEKSRLAEEREARSKNRTCQKCLALGVKGPDGVSGPPKPERTHHCRICGRCWLKFDHHCPWINQCVGLRNERYFLLFMSYLSFSCLVVVYTGWHPMLLSLDHAEDWPHLSPRTFVLLTWILTAAMGFAVGIMALWQAWQILNGETTVETSDNEYYRQFAQTQGRLFVNPYDLGRLNNLAYFFNVRPYSTRGWWTVLVPTKVPPASDGWTWEKRAGWEKKVVEFAEELTDEEDEAEED